MARLTYGQERALEREEGVLDAQLERGDLTPEEYRRQLRDLHREAADLERFGTDPRDDDEGRGW